MVNKYLIFSPDFQHCQAATSTKLPSLKLNSPWNTVFLNPGGPVDFMRCFCNGQVLSKVQILWKNQEIGAVPPKTRNEFPKKPRCKPANLIAVLRPKLLLFCLHVLSPSPTVRKTIGFSHRARCVSLAVYKTPRAGRPRILNLKASIASLGVAQPFRWSSVKP